jgi:dATP pyrophosphohydrolase
MMSDTPAAPPPSSVVCAAAEAAPASAPSTRPPKIPESVLVVIHTADLQVLLIERADQPGYWQSVTGSKDHPDEALIETARREVAEETGIVVGAPGIPLQALRDWGLRNVYEIYPVWRHRYAPGVTHNTEHVFGLLVPAGTPVVLSPREHLRHQWLPWQEAADRCFSPSNAEALLHLPRLAAGLAPSGTGALPEVGAAVAQGRR